MRFLYRAKFPDGDGTIEIYDLKILRKKHEDLAEITDEQFNELIQPALIEKNGRIYFESMNLLYF